MQALRLDLLETTSSGQDAEVLQVLEILRYVLGRAVGPVARVLVLLTVFAEQGAWRLLVDTHALVLPGDLDAILLHLLDLLLVYL